LPKLKFQPLNNKYAPTTKDNQPLQRKRQRGEGRREKDQQMERHGYRLQAQRLQIPFHHMSSHLLFTALLDSILLEYDTVSLGKRFPISV
jgi:hypothetical protein